VSTALSGEVRCRRPFALCRLCQCVKRPTRGTSRRAQPAAREIVGVIGGGCDVVCEAVAAVTAAAGEPT
jgi:hypothetical protein